MSPPDQPAAPQTWHEATTDERMLINNCRRQHFFENIYRYNDNELASQIRAHVVAESAALKAEVAEGLKHTPFCNAFGPTPCACICEVVTKADLAALKVELDRKAYMLRMNSIDWAEDDTRIKELAKPFGIDVEGDSNFVPSMVDVVEHMAEMLAKARELITGLEAQVKVRGKMGDEVIQAMIRAEQDNARLRAALETNTLALEIIYGYLASQQDGMPILPAAWRHALERICKLDKIKAGNAAIAGTPAPAAQKEQP